MNKKNNTTQYEYHEDPQNVYRTGATQPPKSRVGIVAILLALVILFCGFTTILSLMNINLLQQLSMESREESPISFRATEPVSRQSLSGQALPPFWQDYYQIPQGVYITRTAGDHPLCPGDIILNINGRPVSAWEDFSRQLSAASAGDKIPVTVFRNGKQQQLILTIHD